MELGFDYDPSHGADDVCYELMLEGKPIGVVEVPFEWVRDDAVYSIMHRFQGLRPYKPPSDVFNVVRRELEIAKCRGERLRTYDASAHDHLQVTDWIVDEIIKHAESLGEAWFATHCEIAAWPKRMLREPPRDVVRGFPSAARESVGQRTT